MARVVLTPHEVTRDGIVVSSGMTAADPVNFNQVANDGNVRIFAVNGDTDPHTITFHLPEIVDGQQVPPKVVTVAAGSSNSALFGPFPVSIYGGTLKLDADDATVLVGAFHG